MIIKTFKFSPRKLLTAAALTAFAFIALKTAPPAAKAVFSATVAKTERLLPIYCVETDKPKVAISFDAAWGGYK